MRGGGTDFMTRPVGFQHTLSERLALVPIVVLGENFLHGDTTGELLVILIGNCFIMAHKPSQTLVLFMFIGTVYNTIWQTVSPL